MENKKMRLRDKLPALVANSLIFGMTGVLIVLAFVDRAGAIPTFARKYHTSCVTCHKAFPMLNNVGEAFRRNGYQFPTDDETLVKDEPIPLGNDRYKEMFPNSIWPSDLPNLPPIFIRAQQQVIFNTDPGPDGIKWDQNFPREVVLGGAGTFGRDISAWWELAFNPTELEDGEPPEVERMFITFSNLFAYDPEEDEDGVHEGNRWITLPRYALNVRIGKLEPQVFNHALSEHARIGVQAGLAVKQRIGANRFRFEPAQNAIEAHGIIRQNNSYVIGFANGGNSGQRENNNNKDVYFRVARKWFGYPLDGVIGSAEPVGNDTVRGQSPDGDDDAVYSMPGLDFWRAWDLETGVFGWWGLSEIKDGAITRSDYFRRIGVDARLQWFNWDVYGLAYWGHDTFAGRVAGVDLGSEDHTSYSVQADYYWKPWLVTFVRYEETDFEKARAASEEGRIVPGANFIIRQNLKLQTEWVVDTTGKDTGGAQATNELLFQLDYVY